MKIAVPRETAPNETRVAASPETVKRFVGLGLDVVVEAGAGAASSFSDAAFREAGADIATGYAATTGDADVVLKVRAPNDGELDATKPGQSIISVVYPSQNEALLKSAAGKGVDLFSMDLMPRITRAQSMDVLSSQSNLAGYKAVIDGAAYYGRAMPMMMTAAGTVAPAKVFVMGAGVAGLQAIATARRLGAVVSATDVRYAAKEQVESLGATFVTVDEEEMKSAETEGGYAKEMSDDFKARQAEFVADHIKKQNIVITTALIPGRPAPKLVTEPMVRSMQPGSVVVDLAAEQGGNVAVTRPGEAVDVDGVVVVGFENVPGRLATDASALYAKNVFNFFSTFFDKDSSSFPTDWDDEIIKNIVLTRNGAVIHPAYADAAATEAANGSATNDAASDVANDVKNPGDAAVADDGAAEESEA
ncbi:MAG: Re/Si-specific NAD(P)(+) transhydrogenase subunit alpha [Pseudomonadota bacterium]